MGLRDFVPPIISNLFSVKKEGNGYFYVFQSTKSPFADVDYEKAFLEIPEINAVISMKARAFSNMKLKEVDQEGNEKPTSEGQALIKLLRNPNWFQGGKEFLIQTKLFREIHGNEYLFRLFPLGFSPELSRVKSIYTLPPLIVKAKYDNSVPFYLHAERPKVTYKVKAEKDWDELPENSVIHFNDNRVAIKTNTDKDLINGESKLKSLSAVINNMRMAYESRGMILAYRGANGAWVNKGKDTVGGIPLKQEDRDTLQNMYSKHGTLFGQNQTIVTDSDLAWVQAGTNNPMNLGIFEELQQDFDKTLDTFGVPPELFVRHKGSTYENQHTAEKGLYIRTIMPEANEWVGGIWDDFKPEGAQTNVIADYMHLPIFQEDLKSRGDALTTMVNALSKALQDQAISIEQYQEELTKFGIQYGTQEKK